MPEPTTTDFALNAVLDEIRWRHPSVRISCGALVAGPQLRVLASRQPATMLAMPDLPIVGSPVRQWIAVLEAAGAELVVPAVADDARLDDLDETIVAVDTAAMALFSLRNDGELIGFLRVDALDAAELSPALLEAVRNASPAAALAVELERERVDGWAARRTVVELESAIRSQRERDREAVGALRQAMDELRDRLRRVSAQLEPGPKQALDASLAEGGQRIDTVLRWLAEPLAEAQ